LLTADGFAPTTIAEELGTSQPTVRKWRARYVDDGLVGLRNEPRPGRPRSLDDQRVADLLNQALQTRPAKQTHWSVRSFAAEANISKDMAHRLFRATGIAPHRSRSFKLSNDPAFVEKVRDITGLYLNPPDHALVLCVDEKSQIQALERTQPLLPMGFGYVEGVPTTTFATAPRRCSPHSMLPTARSSPEFELSTGIRSSSTSCARSTSKHHPSWTCI
jgi:putative transposase